ncbi:MAG: DUF4037 domain-containing protein [bacterium]|nr:DUF4037 domain-containing protein [bacterium]
MANEIIDISRGFFEDVVRPLLEQAFPEEAQQVACGVFGYGSECLGMDDEISQDHHWGLRVDMLIPDAIFKAKSGEILERIGANLPETYGGFALREGHVAGAGIAPESFEGFLTRTIGLTGAPASYSEWLDMPEEDIVHVTNGEVWYDPSGRFTGVREVLSYYPEPVWLRRISHWCRYFSGMGVYALKRAVMRNNEVYATTSFGRSIKWAMELTFLLNQQYFPYDKWLYPFFKNLPELADQMDPLISEGVQLGTAWKRRLEILEAISDLLDGQMVKMGIISPHPGFVGSETSGYRLLEHAYAAIVKQLPDEVKNYVPKWDQVYLEEFHTSYVDGLPIEDWDRLLNLTVVEGK